MSGACKESAPAPKTVGPPTQLVATTTALSAGANIEITTPVVVTVQDANGMAVSGQTVTFAIIAGGGIITGNTNPISDANGQVTAPTWRLGKSAVPQVLRAILSPTIFRDINATVISNFTITVRFYGPTPSAAQQALFTGAAARLSGIITGDVPDLSAQPIDVAPCGVTGQTLNEAIDDVIIFASAQFIDGKGQVLGRAGPCYIRDPGVHSTIVGAMQFDSDDLDDLITSGLAQDVITHEMLHVLGVGTLWELNTTNPQVHLLQGGGTIDPRYVGEQGRQGCVAFGGTATCATNVPLEGNVSGPGTADSHWREPKSGTGPSVFGNELMTGYLNQGSNPLSSLTVRALADLGYVVNTADNDNFIFPGAALRAGSASMATASPGTTGNWEVLDHFPLMAIDRAGKVRVLRPRK